MSMTVRVADSQLRAALAKAPAEINAALAETVELSAIDFESAVIDGTPVGATSHLRQSITHAVTGSGVSMVGRVYSQDRPIKVASVETGRKAGTMPPRAPIELWVRRKLGITDPRVVFLIQRAIGRRGTKGAQMFAKGYQRALPRVDARIAALRRTIARVL
jgi:hypothetical protein